jgi:hypothetical protein
MNDSVLSILDLPDEILLIIFKKLSNIDVLYSLMGIHEKLDNVVCGNDFTRVVDLLMISSYEADDSRPEAIPDRFLTQILPRIHDHVEHLTIDTCFFERVFHTGNYPNLRKLNLELHMVSNIFDGMLLDFRSRTILFIYCIFLEKSSFIHAFKDQISELVVTFMDKITDVSMKNLLIDNYASIFALFGNLKYFELDVNDFYSFIPSLFNSSPSTRCFSSSIVHLNIKLNNIDDCLYLLDGRLSQLHTFIVHLDSIHDPSKPRSRNSLRLIINAVIHYI